MCHLFAVKREVKFKILDAESFRVNIDPLTQMFSYRSIRERGTRQRKQTLKASVQL